MQENRKMKNIYNIIMTNAIKFYVVTQMLEADSHFIYQQVHIIYKLVFILLHIVFIIMVLIVYIIWTNKKCNKNSAIFHMPTIQPKFNGQTAKFAGK